MEDARPQKLFNIATAALMAAFLLLGFGKGGFLESAQKYVANNVHESQNYSAQSASPQNISSAASKVSASVVSVNVMQKVYNNFSDYPLAFDVNLPAGAAQNAPATDEEVAAGTGFFITSDGYILTNNHVVENSSDYYTVTLSGGNGTVPAQVVFKDPADDLAIIKIPGNNYSPAALGDSSAVKIGQGVAGIGNALGKFPGTVSTGNVIGLDKNIIASGLDSSEQLGGLIETNANMYPGDSGGPLLDTGGKVVGVDVAIDENTGTSFSIPVNTAQSFIQRTLGTLALK